MARRRSRASALSPDTDTARVLVTLCEVGRPMMLEWGMGLDSCIAATRVGMDVLRRLRIHATPLAVKVAAFNEKAHEFMQAKHPEWVREMRDGAYGLGAGFGPGPRPHKWDGHLVLIAGGYLVDLSADQLARPQHGIEVEAFVTPLPKGALRGAAEKLVVKNPRGGTIGYEADPENDAWKRAPDWSRERWAALVDEVYRAVRVARSGCPSLSE